MEIGLPSSLQDLTTFYSSACGILTLHSTENIARHTFNIISEKQFYIIRKKEPCPTYSQHLKDLLSLSKAGLQDIYLSIYISIYIAPLQGNYSEALPAQARPKRRVLRSI